MPHPIDGGQGHKRKSWVAAYCGVSTKTIDRWLARGLLPQPIRPNSRISLFNVAETLAAIEALKKGGE